MRFDWRIGKSSEPYVDNISKLASEQSKIAYILDTHEILRLNSFRLTLFFYNIESCQHIKVTDKLGGEHSGLTRFLKSTMTIGYREGAVMPIKVL